MKMENCEFQSVSKFFKNNKINWNDVIFKDQIENGIKIKFEIYEDEKMIF